MKIQINIFLRPTDDDNIELEDLTAKIDTIPKYGTKLEELTKKIVEKIKDCLNELK